jgi:hypothetical protein
MKGIVVVKAKPPVRKRDRTQPANIYAPEDVPVDKMTLLQIERDTARADAKYDRETAQELRAERDRLREALVDLVQECEEYARINHLHNDDGSPATPGAMKHAYAALAKEAGQSSRRQR